MKFYVLENSYSDGYHESQLKSKYFRTLEGAIEYLEKVIEDGEVTKRWNRPSEGILDAVVLAGDYGDEEEYYTLIEETFEEDK